ncbi:Tim44 domain-containing protein [Thiomicrorhabdus cannonii]|uniref:Tim44 domain-containing protein n=1 Tax=Thiomicrorhabdus cannonii TaxID=2748011 RepID=UPI0015B86FE2|nr:TIM44-like domain-containing protein [Thiomicrorhabdus cannonii]
MKQFWILFLGVVLSWSAMMSVAEAKRLGGGSSIGYSKSVPSKSYNTTQKTDAAKSQPAAASAAGASASAGASKWLGPLAGIAAGGLIAAMLFGEGFEGLQIMDLLIFALIAFMLYKMFVARRRSAYQAAGVERTQGYVEPNPLKKAPVLQRESAPQAAAYDPQAGSIIGSALGETPSAEAVRVHDIPAWFDAEQFVAGAKQHFVTLQKAWDELDVAEIESYCTPELFAAIKAQMQGGEPGDNVTVVDSLYAEIADMAIDGDYFVVSLRFSGFIQEAADQGAHAFTEIWHIRRHAADQGNWLVAGIQQIQ